MNGDNLADLTLEFNIPEMRANGVISLMTEQGYSAGQLLDGSEVAGRDALTIIPEPSSLLLILSGMLLLARRR